jgi:hypothetical protein
MVSWGAGALRLSHICLPARILGATPDSSRVAAQDFSGADGRIWFVIRRCRVCEVKFARWGVLQWAEMEVWLCMCSPARNLWGMELGISNSRVPHAPYIFTTNLPLTLCWSSVFFFFAASTRSDWSFGSYMISNLRSLRWFPLGDKRWVSLF